jgi:GAF domain-containing protein
MGRARERWLPMPSSASVLGSAVAVAAVFLLAELGLAILLWQTDPRDYVGLAFSALMAAVLLANFVVGVLVARRAETSRRHEAGLAAELARLMLSACDLHSAADHAGQQLARALKLPFASLELREVPGDEGRWAIPLRNGTTVHGTLLVPADLPKPTRQRLQERVVPSLAALLAAAHDRDAIHCALTASRDRLAALAEQQKALRRVATLVARGVEPSELFAAVTEEMARCLNAGNAGVARCEGDEVVVLAVSQFDPDMKTFRSSASALRWTATTS